MKSKTASDSLFESAFGGRLTQDQLSSGDDRLYILVSKKCSTVKKENYLLEPLGKSTTKEDHERI